MDADKKILFIATALGNRLNGRDDVLIRELYFLATIQVLFGGNIPTLEYFMDVMEKSNWNFTKEELLSYGLQNQYYF